MHIAWLGKKYPFCGNVTYSREITNALLDRGYQVSFLHFATEDTKLDKWPEFHEVSLPCIYKSQGFTIPTLKSSKVLSQALQKLEPDIVHASLTLSPLDFLLPEICEELNIPLVATFHAQFDSKPRNIKSGTQFLAYQFYAPFLANYDRVIIFSEIQKDLLTKLGVPSKKVAVIPNGVDVDKYSPGVSNLKTELNASRVFLYLGRISTEKNVESLLKAWKHSDMGNDSCLAIVGDGPLAPSLQMFYGDVKGVSWFGYVSDEQRRIEILRGADVFILPSLVEGLSLALLEAMSSGLACVATDAGADGEVLEKGAGIILNTHNVTSQLQTLLPVFRDHPELNILLGQKARQRVLERYTLSRNITQLEMLYAEVVRERNPLSSLI
ncbi:MAG: glycosyltransferase family 4 protein [Okeania sp. SIO3I5]|uniref:glycosyltransferase family 4 protein n=1 Tax=Okeania sp. SIO3I5 TaxID=2607805 RepID=UPI0013B69BFD|nr:glycosyltransferase family 4 protein [Okeania sp. SIO3I5]NEQ39714.1 glycosyltransferase family 4 protein [Okeania sp. SIO3I5]